MKPIVGIVPLMLELYKGIDPEFIRKQTPFLEELRDLLSREMTVTLAPICASYAETNQAVRTLEGAGVQGIVVVCTSYATSVSSAKPILATPLPVLLFSTSPQESMAEGMTGADIMLNHGIHGYMDLANVLKRNRRRFTFAAGHYRSPEALAKISRWAKICAVRAALQKAKVGITGYTFDGMADLGLDPAFLNTRLGPEIIHIPLSLITGRIREVDQKEVDTERALDGERFDVADNVDRDTHDKSNRLYLALRSIVEERGLSGYTMHFEAVLDHPDMEVHPFLALSKLQERGIGYAGEGDILGTTAWIMLNRLCGRAMFSEPFCPDFRGGRIVMGHMGESNPAFGTKTVLKRRRASFGATVDSVIPDVHMKEGTLTVANLAVFEDNRLQLTAFRGTVCPKIPGDPGIDMPYFHLKPELPLEDLLSAYGLAGGSHHVILMEDDTTEELFGLAGVLELDYVLLR